MKKVIIITLSFFASMLFGQDCRYEHIRQVSRVDGQMFENLYVINSRGVKTLCAVYIENSDGKREFIQGSQESADRYWSEVRDYRFKLYLLDFSTRESVVDTTLEKSK